MICFTNPRRTLQMSNAAATLPSNNAALPHAELPREVACYAAYEEACLIRRPGSHIGNSSRDSCETRIVSRGRLYRAVLLPLRLCNRLVLRLAMGINWIGESLHQCGIAPET